MQLGLFLFFDYMLKIIIYGLKKCFSFSREKPSHRRDLHHQPRFNPEQINHERPPLERHEERPPHERHEERPRQTERNDKRARQTQRPPERSHERQHVKESNLHPFYEPRLKNH